MYIPGIRVRNQDSSLRIKIKIVIITQGCSCRESGTNTYLLARRARARPRREQHREIPGVEARHVVKERHRIYPDQPVTWLGHVRRAATSYSSTAPAVVRCTSIINTYTHSAFTADSNVTYAGLQISPSVKNERLRSV